MASLRKSFNSMPNFRLIGGSLIELGGKKEPIKLYRSSRPDFLKEEEIQGFMQLGVRSILDFRSAKEYAVANGSKFLDKHYSLYKVLLPSSGYSEKKSVLYHRVITTEQCNPADSSRKHFLINFFQINYVWAIYKRAPWYIKLYSLFWLLIDVILNTNYRNFVRVFAKNVLNKEGILGNYIDILSYSQVSICAALKLLTDPDNVPAMINCAHGKDRTGIVSAMILACLGRSKEDIALDYAISEEELHPIMARIYEEVVDRFHMCKTFTSAKADTMLSLLNYIDDKYGSIPDYLESIGFSRDDQAKLRNNIT